MGKKKSHEEEFRRGSEQLRQSGLQLNRFLRSLCLVSKNNGEQDEKRIWPSSSCWEKSPTLWPLKLYYELKKVLRTRISRKRFAAPCFKLSPKGFKIPEDKRVEEKVSVPWEYADMILYEGFEKAKSRRQSELENFHQLRSIVNTGKPKARIIPFIGGFILKMFVKEPGRTVPAVARRAGVAFLDFRPRLGGTLSRAIAGSTE